MSRLYMPHPGHFVGARTCEFRLCTHVIGTSSPIAPHGFIVSTVGEWRSRPDVNGLGQIQELGVGTKDKPALYETMVFVARPSKRLCCPFEATGDELETVRYSTAEAAVAGHEELCTRFEKEGA